MSAPEVLIMYICALIKLNAGAQRGDPSSTL